MAEDGEFALPASAESSVFLCPWTLVPSALGTPISEGEMTHQLLAYHVFGFSPQLYYQL